MRKEEVVRGEGRVKFWVEVWKRERGLDFWGEVGKKGGGLTESQWNWVRWALRPEKIMRLRRRKERRLRRMGIAVSKGFRGRAILLAGELGVWWWKFGPRR